MVPSYFLHSQIRPILVKHRRILAEAMLVLVTFFWGTTFVVVKHVIQTLPVHWFHTLRFGLAAVVLWGVGATSSGVRVDAKKHFQRGKIVGAGSLLGFALFAGYAFQTFGLKTTTASKSAFITGTAVLWVPLLLVAVLRKRPKNRTFLAAGVGLIGLFLLVFNRGYKAVLTEELVVGDILTLACALVFAVHIIFTKLYSHRYPTTLLTAIQLTVVAFLSLAGSVLWNEGHSWHFSGSLYAAVAFLALVPTAFNFWVMTRMQRYTTAGRTAVIFLLEPVFAAATAWLVLGELFTLSQWFGAAIILVAILLLELQFSRFGEGTEPDSPGAP